MTQIIKAADRFHLESDWLSAYWLFSFDRYHDPDNMQFGPLRVFNHDTIQPGAGFPTHSHREMEIITYVLSGALRHKDSTGGLGVINAGEVQRMTAGTGVAHSEYNASETEPTRLLQMWVLPARAGLTPSYEQRQFTPEERAGLLLPIASGQGIGDGVQVEQDTTFYILRLRAGEWMKHEMSTQRRMFIYVLEGQLTMNGEALLAGDQARLTDTARLELRASATSEIIFIDLP